MTKIQIYGFSSKWKGGGGLQINCMKRKFFGETKYLDVGHVMGKKEIFRYVLEILTVQCTVTVHMTDTPYTNKAHTQHTQTNTLTHSDSLSIKLKSKYLFQVPIIS